MKKLRLFYAALQYDYGIPTKGFSYEHMNFYDTLARLSSLDVFYFPIDVHLRNSNRKTMNELLLKRIDDFSPDLCFFVLFTDEIYTETLEEIKNRKNTVLLNWFCDDHWRFEGFSKFYAPFFHWIITTDKNSVEKYRNIGYYNSILSQWGYNHFLYSYKGNSGTDGVSFVGGTHSSRKKIVDELLKSGFPVKCWGNGWSRGRISFDDMLRVYSSSTINLNFTESSMRWGIKPVAKVFLNRRADNTYRLNRYKEIKANLNVLLKGRTNQIKGRNFEIPGTGGFLLTEYADNIEEYFVPGKEIVVFKGIDELIDKLRYYLVNEDERENIRRAGHNRALRDHTFEKRLTDIFNKIGFN